MCLNAAFNIWSNFFFFFSLMTKISKFNQKGHTCICARGELPNNICSQKATKYLYVLYYIVTRTEFIKLYIAKRNCTARNSLSVTSQILWPLAIINCVSFWPWTLVFMKTYGHQLLSVMAAITDKVIAHDWLWICKFVYS